MPLTSAQIKVGVVAYLEVGVLHADNQIKQPPSPAPRDGPFVCFATSGQLSAWTEISTQAKDGRLELKAEWRKSGAGSWLTDAQYINDGRTTYIGPKSSFVAASQSKDKFQAQSRPRVTLEGVAAVVQAVRARGGNTLEAGA